MRPEWQAHIDELLERYRQKSDQLRAAQRAVGTASATVTTEDEMITVTVGSRGRLIGLEFNPRVYRRMGPSELAAAVLAAAGEASSQVDGQVRAALAPLRSAGPGAATGGTGGPEGRAGEGDQPAQPAPLAPSAQPAPLAQPTQGKQSAQPSRPEKTGETDPGADIELTLMPPASPDDLDAFRERYGLPAAPGDS
jgi:DNA-binding protein YbaB